MEPRAYSDGALHATRPVMRLAISGLMVRTDEQERELQVEIATKISELTCDRAMRLALEKLEARMCDEAVSDANFRALAREEISYVLGVTRLMASKKVDPHRILEGATT